MYAAIPGAVLSLCCKSQQVCKSYPRLTVRMGLPSSTSLPSLLSGFGLVPLVSLQPSSHSSGPRGTSLSGWQPSCYVAPEASYQAGVTSPASTLKGNASAIRRAATVALGA